MRGNRLYIEFATASPFGPYWRVESKRGRICRVKCREIIADNLSKAGWSWGCVATVDRKGQTIWVVAAERDRQRFIVHADEKLTAFLEFDSPIRAAKASGSIALPGKKIIVRCDASSPLCGLRALIRTSTSPPWRFGFWWYSRHRHYARHLENRDPPK